jgi:hypothetical protein
MAEDVTDMSVCMGMACGLVFEGLDKKCPECGKLAISQASVRRRGWVALACGVVLLGIMGTVLWNVVPLLLASDHEVGGARFTGTQDDLVFMLAIFAMVIAAGLAALVAGYVQVVHGHRQRDVIRVMLVIAAALFAIGWLVRRGVIS